MHYLIVPLIFIYKSECIYFAFPASCVGANNLLEAVLASFRTSFCHGKKLRYFTYDLEFEYNVSYCGCLLSILAFFMNRSSARGRTRPTCVLHMPISPGPYLNLNSWDLLLLPAPAACQMGGKSLAGHRRVFSFLFLVFPLV